MNAKKSRIEMYMHCKTCVKVETVNGEKVPVDYGEKLAFGSTREGFQLVCENCGKNVFDMDLLGQHVVLYDKNRSIVQRSQKLRELIKSYKGK